jgi:hypothetical protein
MASGKPIISTVKMGYSPFKKYNIGIEIEDAKPKDIADAIVKIKNLDIKEFELLSSNAMNAAQDFDFKIHTNKLIDIIGLFDFWYEHIKSVPDKKSFKTQSNLFFIIHIMNKNNIKLDKDKINNILSKLVDSRKSAETRYNYILSIIENEK